MVIARESRRKGSRGRNESSEKGGDRRMVLSCPDAGVIAQEDTVTRLTTEALKSAGGYPLALAIAAIFGFLAAATVWTIKSGERKHHHAWSALHAAALFASSSKVNVGVGIALPVNKLLQLACASAYRRRMFQRLHIGESSA